MLTPERWSEFAVLLDQRRKTRHLSIRATARLAGVPATTVQGWLDGTHSPSPTLHPQFLKLVAELELDDQLPPGC
jgi:DNA-binding transcriptional regulator YiaG